MAPLLEFNNVCATDNDGISLENFNLELEEHKCVALVGTNESGINLPLYLSNKTQPAESGEIRVFSKNIGEYLHHEIYSLRADLTLIQGEPVFLNNMPMQNNMHLPLLYHTTLGTKEIEERLAVARELFQLKEPGNRLPAFFDRGTQKKLAMVRGIAMRPKVLLLEQPSWNLRHSDRKILANALKEIRATLKTTVLMATTDFVLAQEVADIIYLFSGGKVVAQGSAEDVKKTKTKHPKIWGTLEIRAL